MPHRITPENISTKCPEPAGSVFSQKWPATATFEALFSAQPTGLGVPLSDVINGTNGWTKMRAHNDSLTSSQVRALREVAGTGQL